MSLDGLVKYIMWVVFFVLVSAGLYFMLKKAGVL